MNTIALIIGIGIVAFLLLYFVFQFDKKEHIVFIYIISIFFIFMILLIPKVLLDEKNDCSIQIANETIAGNTTSYEYEKVCFNTDSNTANIFYKMYLWIIRIFFFYIILYVNYHIWIKSKLFKFGVLRK